MGHLAPWPDESDEMWRVGAGGGHQPGMGHRPRQGAGRDARIAALRPPDRPTVRAVKHGFREGHVWDGVTCVG